MPNSFPTTQEIGRRGTNCSRLDHRTPDRESKRTTAADRELIEIGKMFTVQLVRRKKKPVAFPRRTAQGQVARREELQRAGAIVITDRTVATNYE